MRGGSLDLVISGSRANGLTNTSPLPDDEFHWCNQCATVAFSAVEENRLKKLGWTR